MCKLARRLRHGIAAAAPSVSRMYRLPVAKGTSRAEVTDAAHADLVALAAVVGGITRAAARLGLSGPDALHDLHAGRSLPGTVTLLSLSRAASGLPGGGNLAALAAASGLVPVERLRPILSALAALAA